MGQEGWEEVGVPVEAGMTEGVVKGRVEKEEVGGRVEKEREVMAVVLVMVVVAAVLKSRQPA